MRLESAKSVNLMASPRQKLKVFIKAVRRREKPPLRQIKSDGRGPTAIAKELNINRVSVYRVLKAA